MLARRAARRDRRRGRDRQDDARRREGAATREARASRRCSSASTRRSPRCSPTRSRRSPARPASSRSRPSTSSARTSVARPACCRLDRRRVPQDWWDRTLPARARRRGRAARAAVPRDRRRRGPGLRRRLAAVARGAAVRWPRRRAVRLPRPGAGDLPRRCGRAASACRSYPLDTNCRNAQPIHEVVARLGGEGMAHRRRSATDGRPPEFIEAGRRGGHARGAADGPPSAAGRGGASRRGTSRS